MILFCSVCFRGADAAMRDSLNAGIFVLLGVTGLVLACIAVFFVRLAQRASVSANADAGEPAIEDLLGSPRPLGAFRR